MPLLEAFLALALTLLSLAMIATLIVEMIHRIAGTRSENLKVMLGELYDRELRDRDPKKMFESLLKKSGKKLDNDSKTKEIVEELLKKGSKELKKNGSELKEMVKKLLKEGGEKLDDDQSRLKDRVEAELKRNDFINGLICNPLKKGETGGRPRNGPRGLLDWLGIKGPTNRKNLASISTKELFEKLAYTDVGKQIKAETEEKIDEKVDQLARSYDEIGVAASDLFKRKAQIVSLFAGVLAAFLFNADALSILEAYLDDPQSRAKAVARTDVVLENFTKMTKTGIGADTAPSAEAMPATETPAGTTAPAGAETPPGVTDTGYKTNKEVVEDVNRIREEIKKLGDMGIPLGYSKDKAPLVWIIKKPPSDPNEAVPDPNKTVGEPNEAAPDPNKTVGEPNETDSDPNTAGSDRKGSDRDWWPGIVFWALKVLGTGFLIGLGGPFWFNVVRKLTDVLQVVRGGAPAAAERGDSATGPADPVKSNRNAFKMTGGLPDAVKAQAKLTAATKVAADADKAVKAAADALMGTRKAAGKDPSELMKTAIAAAEEALGKATEAQKKAHQSKERTSHPYRRPIE